MFPLGYLSNEKRPRSLMNGPLLKNGLSAMHYSNAFVAVNATVSGGGGGGNGTSASPSTVTYIPLLTSFVPISTRTGPDGMCLTASIRTANPPPPSFSISPVPMTLNTVSVSKEANVVGEPAGRIVISFDDSGTRDGANTSTPTSPNIIAIKNGIFPLVQKIIPSTPAMIRNNEENPTIIYIISPSLPKTPPNSTRI
ncbi:MAG: hypothetical protein A2825_00710 [Candidatus Taylorbacteria bacterium RIFCSPHIGHO2_01_FULL_43_120]|nr:MAG: hypothetical protein A2825_00710 [Candidatus Taylorbacteria bacterium RIFCSPHIGHO2_01_FULL_43_120]OHA22868.1 MAG: hypothetical protein A3B98_01585 [Candidatus Taylorbacteria bacterium RIFCSPHIGHO2_02_FULL_43_55]